MTIRSPKVPKPFASAVERKAAAMVLELHGDGTYEVTKCRYDMQRPVEATIFIDPDDFEVEHA